MMKNNLLESQVVEKIREALDIHYPGFYFKCHGGLFQIVGLPDIIGVHKGRFIAIEVKLPSKRKTYRKNQRKIITHIKLCGGVAFMATSPKDTIKNMKEMLK